MTWRALPSRPGRGRWLAVTAVALVSLSVFVTACGGGASPSSVARIGKTTGTTVADIGANVTTPPNPVVAAKQYKQALKFSQCMQTHGVADFPDPGPGGGIQITSKQGSSSDLNPNNPTFSAAQNACQKYSPVQPPSAQQQAQSQARALAFAACMRKHGVPNFPDPQFISGGRPVEKIIAGVDPGSPRFQAAQQQCSKSNNGGGGGFFFSPAP